MSSPLPLVERKRQQARRRIIEAAEELFRERGFADVSVSDIAERAEVGRTTFFRHFGDKQEVVFAQEQELLETIETAHRAADVPTPTTVSQAIEQLCPIVLALCAQASADPAAYSRHFQLVEQHAELRARDEVKMQEFAGKLTELLTDRGGDRATAVLAGQIALACYQSAKRLGNNPRTLVKDTREAFRRVLALGNPEVESNA